MKKILILLLHLFNSIIPRNKNIWITGRASKWEYNNDPPSFFDNSKYFYLYLHNHTNAKVYWLSTSCSEIELLKSFNLPVVKFPSVKGIYLTLRAKYFFHHYGPYQISNILQMDSIQINLWHGTPIKKIMYDVYGKPQKDQTRMEKLTNNQDNVYMCSTSEYVSENIYQSAFDKRLDLFLNFGYPRLDVLKLNKKESTDFCIKYSPQLLRYINISKEKSRVFLYMPTFRDDDYDYLDKAKIPYKELDSKLADMNAVFFMKLHPLTKNKDISGYNNIVMIDNDVDIYPFLVFTDYLVTDYSSIFFDYLLFDKEIIFIPFDLDQFIDTRQLYFPYNDITPGKKYYTFQDFVADLNEIDRINFSVERNRIKNMFIQDYNYDASEKIYEFFISRSNQK